MPFYDYECKRCGTVVKDHQVAMEDRDKPQFTCNCDGTPNGQPMERMFPVEAAMGFQPFEPYYDEGLGFNVHGREERKEIMAALGLQEAGGSEAGLETSPHAITMKPRPVRDEGEFYWQHKKQLDNSGGNSQNWDVAVEKNGTVSPVDLSTAKTL